MIANNSAICAVDILSGAHSVIVDIAADVGIDGAALLACLPSPGEMLKGVHVPVMHKRYKGTCSVTLYINYTRAGQEWPFIYFWTFKHGGMHRVFNGLRWMVSQQHVVRTSRHIMNIRYSAVAKIRCEVAARQRTIRHKRLLCEYALSDGLRVDHPWLQRRLRFHCTHSVLERSRIRFSGNQLLAPIEHGEYGLVGFHSIFTDVGSDGKRHYLRREGLLKGSYISICADPDSCIHDKTLVCEGLATGLSLALVWSGPIIVALCANNLRAVRESINGTVVFCCDNDQWKPEVGNVGIEKARAAMKPGDELNWPVFAENERKSPTDFNDLLMISNLEELSRQFHSLQSLECTFYHDNSFQ